MKLKASTMWLLAVLTIILSTVFFALLVTELMWFPQVSGHSFAVDWPKVVTAIAPVLILLLLILVTQSSTIKASVGGVRVEFVRGIPFSESNTVMLSAVSVSKGGVSDLEYIIEDIRRSDHAPRILMVVMHSAHRQNTVQFAALRDYVFEISRVAPLQFIVFVDEARRYLAYMEVGSFMRKYPKLGIESLIDDIAADVTNRDLLIRILTQDGRVEGDADLLRLLGRLPQQREQLGRLVTRRYWPLGGEDGVDGEVREDDLVRLGASAMHLINPTPQAAYASMIANGVDGMPVTDPRRRFKGMASKASIQDDVVAQLLAARPNTIPDGSLMAENDDVLTSRPRH